MSAISSAPILAEQPADDERALVERVRGGDTAAFERLFRRYYQSLYEFALRYVKRHADAEEVAQEVLAALWTRRATLDIRDNVRAYLYSAARKRAFDRLTDPRIEAAHLARFSAAVVHETATSESALDTLTRQEVRSELARAIAALPARQREVFLLRADRELRYAEIAQILGITVKNVEVQLRRAVHTLRTVIPQS